MSRAALPFFICPGTFEGHLGAPACAGMDKVLARHFAQLQVSGVIQPHLVDDIDQEVRGAVELLKEVQRSLEDGAMPAVDPYKVAAVGSVIDDLHRARRLLREQLPLQAGGLAGRMREEWVVDLAAMGCVVVGGPPGSLDGASESYSFTSSTSSYDSYDASLVAAAQTWILSAAPEPVVPDLLRRAGMPPEQMLQRIVEIAAASRLQGQECGNPWDARVQTPEYCAYVVGWYRDVMTQEEREQLDNELVLLNAGVGRWACDLGDNQAWRALIEHTLHRVMDDSVWACASRQQGTAAEVRQEVDQSGAAGADEGEADTSGAGQVPQWPSDCSSG